MSGDDKADFPIDVIEVPWNLVVPEADIHLVGYGMRLPNDFTLETLAVLKRCKRVFGLPPVHAPEFGIPPMENLLPGYGEGKERIKTYQEWLDVVLDAAKTDAPVALATYGSAMVGALVTHRILEEAPRRNLTVHVTNTVSCLDGIWADLNIEPFFGFEIWEATAFVDLAVEPDTQANLVLPQAPLFEVTTGPDLATSTMTVSSTIVALRNHLLRFYPPDHEVHFISVRSGTGPRSLTPHIETLPLADLDHPGTEVLSTLFVPRSTTRKGLDFRRPSAGRTGDAHASTGVTSPAQ
jgi:uncharacterized protein YabN with tetrapyrrole methylase and pyrophosphatase domain